MPAPSLEFNDANFDKKGTLNGDEHHLWCGLNPGEIRDIPGFPLLLMFSFFPPIKIKQEIKPLAIKSRVVQDSRKISRVATRMDCQLTQGGNTFDAVIINLSLGGAFISSKNLLPTGSSVTLTLKSPELKNDLKLEGTVLRGDWVMSDHGKLGRFGIRFSHTSLDLIKLISSLNK